jgi:hypothetical protein
VLNLELNNFFFFFSNDECEEGNTYCLWGKCGHRCNIRRERNPSLFIFEGESVCVCIRVCMCAVPMFLCGF